MTQIAEQLDQDGWMLRSGHAEGADQAFEIGTNKMEIHLPWAGYNNAAHGYPYVVPKPLPAIVEIAARYHPKWDELSNPVKLLMCRNVTIILGKVLEAPAKMVICWTPGARLIGGTAHGIRIADAFDIPVFNIADEGDQQRLCDFTKTL
jgi:hypothetical protein